MISVQFGILISGQIYLEALCFYYMRKTPGSMSSRGAPFWLCVNNVAVTDLSFTLKRNYKVLASCLELLQMVRKEFCAEVKEYIAVIELCLPCLY